MRLKMSYHCQALIRWRCPGDARRFWPPSRLIRLPSGEKTTSYKGAILSSLLPDKQHTWIRLCLHTACLEKIKR